jgi:hypothetical protein
MDTSIELCDLDGNIRCYVSKGITTDIILRMFSESDGHEVTLVASIDAEELKSTIKMLEEQE